MTKSELEAAIFEGIRDGSATKFNQILGRLVHLHGFNDRGKVSRAVQFLRMYSKIKLVKNGWKSTKIWEEYKILVLCETTAGIITHIREMPNDEEKCFSGNKTNTRTLCGFKVGWDLPGGFEEARCSVCLERADLSTESC